MWLLELTVSDGASEKSCSKKHVGMFFSLTFIPLLHSHKGFLVKQDPLSFCIHFYLLNTFCYFCAYRAILKSSITWQYYFCTLTGRFCPACTLQSYEELRYCKKQHRIYMNCLPTACSQDLLGTCSTTIFPAGNTQRYSPGSFLSSTLISLSCWVPYWDKAHSELRDSLILKRYSSGL